jgi:hypothetical protein
MFTQDPIITADGDAVYPVTLEQAAKAGEPIKRKPDAKQVWHINHRNRASKARGAEYSLSSDTDMNRELFLKAGTVVYVGFCQ